MQGKSEVQVLAGLISARIAQDAQSLAAQWNHPEGTHTRHFVVDDLLPQADIARIYASFPRNGATWFQRESFRERKKTFAKLDSVDPLIGHITDAFHRPEVLQVVKGISGIEGLEADPELYAGGISMMGRGDFLNPHIDNSHDSTRERYRRLNLLYYISPEWQLDYGGNLELWDERVAVPRVILSKYNRLVVMETDRHSWHSVSPVVVARDRCCVSNYYFSKNSPEQRPYYHVTSFIGRPDQTALRLWGRVDNLARQSVAVLTGQSRGKSLSRRTNDAGR
jgi:Rps23 Pro-64 3,4-dihydroxylase Tpa1-like proline 4-hydroxylase